MKNKKYIFVVPNQKFRTFGTSDEVLREKLLEYMQFRTDHKAYTMDIYSFSSDIDTNSKTLSDAVEHLDKLNMAAYEIDFETLVKTSKLIQPTKTDKDDNQD